MNKKIKSYFEGKNFSISGNTGHGYIDGFETNLEVIMLDNKAPVRLHLAFYASSETKCKIVNAIRLLRIKFLTYSTDSYGLYLGLNDITVNKLMKRMDSILAAITNVLHQHEVTGAGYCPLCGEALDSENSKDYSLKNAHLALHHACVENVNEVIKEENADFNAAKDNILKGTLGALLGALIGVVSLIVLYFLGFISALSAFIATFLGAIFYQKFGGKPNKKMIVIVTSVSIVSMLLAVFLLYALAAVGLTLEYGYEMGMMDAFINMMDVPEFKTEFISNLGMTAFFSVIGALSQLSILKKKTERPSTIK